MEYVKNAFTSHALLIDMSINNLFIERGIPACSEMKVKLRHSNNFSSVRNMSGFNVGK